MTTAQSPRQYVGNHRILLDEAEAENFAAIVERNVIRRLAAVSLLEASIEVESRFGANGLSRLDLLVAEASVDVVPFSFADARSARRA